MQAKLKAINLYTADMNHALHHYERVLQAVPAIEEKNLVEFDLGEITLALRPADEQHRAGTASLDLELPDLAQARQYLIGEGIAPKSNNDSSVQYDSVSDLDGFLVNLMGQGNPRPAPTEGISRNSKVTLREITQDMVGEIIKLSSTLHIPQRHMVATNAVSLAQAHFSPYAWFRAIYADEKPVGFAMMYIGPKDDENPQSETIYFLWRFMIASPYQGMGFGRKAILLLVDELKSRGATEMGVSCGEGDGSPEGFYRELGFVRTGEMHGDEIGMLLKW
jgi:diamine N-acetyltransferase